jgi:hypothetical protein
LTAIAFGLVWVGYTYSLYGYCLIRGYDVKILELMNPVHVFAYPAGGINALPKIPPSQVFPGGGLTALSAGDSPPKPGSQPGMA